MNYLRLLSLASFASVVAGCSGPIQAEPVDGQTAPVVKGTASTEEDDNVVEVNVFGLGFCTGSLLAPNVVLTALHCVSKFDLYAKYTCGPNGELMSQTMGAGEIGEVVAPEKVEIRVGADRKDFPADAHVTRIFSSGSHNICTNDIAVLTLDTDLSPPPLRVRLSKPTPVGEHTTVIGYGEDELGNKRIRHRRTGLRVLAVGAYGQYPRDGAAAPRTIVLGEGLCHGDSGGPSLSEVTGAVTGVDSLAPFSGCIGGTAQNVLTQTGPFESLLTEAADFAGAVLLPEIDPQSGGSGGGTSSGGDPGTGGDPSSGGTNGGEPSTGGAAETGGSASGGTSATGGTTDGSGGSSTSEGGSDIGTAARGGTPGSEGSGSRQDNSCACRLGQTAPAGSAAWTAALSLLAASLIRRRRR